MNKILFIDTVTTGMNPEKCSIYRIGGIYTEDAVEKERFEFRMRPFRNARISEQSLWITGETRSSLLVYKDEADAFKDFIAFLNRIVDIKNPRDKAYLAGFNTAGLDVPFLREWFRRNKNERFRDYFHVQPMDVMTLSAFALMASRSAMPDFHLETAARFLQIDAPIGEVYNCIENAKVSLDIFRMLQKRFGVAECQDLASVQKITRNF